MLQARHLVSAATTQTYDYIFGGGCRYGCIATGEAFVFPKIDEEDPTIVYYHLARSSIDVKGDGKHEFYLRQDFHLPAVELLLDGYGLHPAGSSVAAASYCSSADVGGGLQSGVVEGSPKTSQ